MSPKSFVFFPFFFSIFTNGRVLEKTSIYAFIIIIIMSRIVFNIAVGKCVIFMKTGLKEKINSKKPSNY